MNGWVTFYFATTTKFKSKLFTRLLQGVCLSLIFCKKIPTKITHDNVLKLNSLLGRAQIITYHIIWFLTRGKSRSKTSRCRVENQQTQPTYDAECGNRTRATLVGGECSNHCAIPAPPVPTPPYSNSSLLPARLPALNRTKLYA